ncbi:MAG TPA: hypothetical protein VN808_15505 [Stellaceae bacterium]|nr:hypothetical protein [Stellaceae bacterium]
MRDFRAQRRDRRGECGREGHDALGKVGPLKLRAHCRLDRGALFWSQVGKSLAGLGLSDVLLGQRRQPDEVGGRVILAEIRPHAIKAAVIHQVSLLEPGLAGDDVGAGHQGHTVGGDDAIGKRRRLLIGEAGGPAEHGETRDGDDQENPFEDVADRVLRQAGPRVHLGRHLSFLPSRHGSNPP